MPAAGVLEGQVVDAHGVPLAGVTVTVSGGALAVALAALSDARGGFRLAGLPRGGFLLVFSKEGYQERRRHVQLAHADSVLKLKAALLPVPGARVEVVASRGFVDFRDLDGGGQDLAGSASSASQGVVSAERLEGRPILRAGETLETVPGIIVTQHSGGGKANQYFCRGFNLDHGTDFATTVAGVPVNLPGNAHGQGYMDLNFLIPELVSGIQYWKGSYLAEQGDFSNAGSANINYVNHLDRPTLALEGGSLGHARVLYAASLPAGPGQFLYALEGYHYDGAWQRPDDYRRGNAFLRYSQGDADNGLALSGVAYTGTWNANHQVPQRAIDQGLIGAYGNLDPSDGGRAQRLSLGLDWRCTDGAGQTRLQAYVLDYAMTLWNDFTFFLIDPVHGDQVEQTERRRAYGVDLSRQWSQDLGGLGLDQQFGLQARADAIGQVALFPSEARQRLGVTSDDSVRQLQLAPYAQSSVRIGSHFRAILGLRDDFYRFQVDNRAPVPAGVDPLRLSGAVTARLLSPKLNLAFGPWDSTEFYLTRADGFHSNDARGVVKRADLAGEALTPATPLVKSRAMEAGLRTRPLDTWQTSFSLWRLDMDSELVFAADSGTTEASRPSRRTGIEWSNDLAPRPWLNVDFDYAFSRARFRDGNPVGDRIPEAIEGTGSLGIAVKDAAGRSANLRLRYFGPRPLIEDDSVRSHGSTLVQVRLAWQLSARLGLSLEVMNALNAKVNDIEYYYLTRLKQEALAGDPGRMDRMVHPSDPRSLRLASTWRF